ncbi:hypothetical protein BO78DRAFT_183168 [Aspergillus sclerotiicarbonarius CBS 121057]|uniref:Uncharacterized protein n=1 Tax=Aspergillus sclerotiicarbonarius (strain CBS 121057 / IBT 28362) TaxID=1448318 RepID=A0A319EKM7_ASPSB|nr:hypothetical protein BO78DRAFT_183168 [Aspergillus sclerotiicarbonarius CBS 121057]
MMNMQNYDYRYEQHEQSLLEQREGGPLPINILIPFTFLSYPVVIEILLLLLYLFPPFTLRIPIWGTCSFGYEALLCLGVKDHVLRRIMSILFRGPQISVIRVIDLWLVAIPFV